MRDRETRDSIDFYERLGSDADVVLEPGYNQDEIFDDQFARRATEINRNPVSSSAVAVIPARQGPWSSNNSFGIQRDFSPNERNEQTILRLPEWDAPQVWSLMLGLTFSERGGEDFAIGARIEPGAGGFIENFEMDWQAGAAITVIANTLNVVGLYEDVVQVPTDLRLSVLVGKRPLAGAAPQRTRNLAVVAGTTEVVSIPRYAKRLNVMQRSTPPGDAFASTTDYRFLSGASAGTTIARFTGDQIATPYFNSIPIPGGAKSLRIQNTGLNLITPILVFSLGL